MYLTSLEKCTKIRPNMEGAKNVLKQIPVGKKEGTPLFSFRVFTIEPQGHTPYHIHDFEHVNYVISGKGSVIVNDTEHEIKSGDFILVLPGEKHQYKNTAVSEDLILICAVPKDYE